MQHLGLKPIGTLSPAYNILVAYTNNATLYLTDHVYGAFWTG